ncbi:MAG: hypothetical protein KIA06_07955 [Finegoldia magna]|uniref:hypothetical protein n=1 Tax=Finegoldia magna TaxID=1260 RepID=UPI0026EC6381|nr:hypothetical protein [Finegoldia magna]MBS5967362.1 hypothetical protein [Finegoldia magna]
MSRFLGKIHYIMFDKINYVDKITRSMSKLLDDVDLKNIESGALEDLIDTDNIHGWLQVRVAIVEDNLAKILSELKKEGRLEDALKIAYDFGAKEDFSGDASDAFQFMSDKFLDGMPCDMANLPVESNYGEFRWVKRIDVHEQYYIYGESSEVYDEFRHAWLDGLLSGCDVEYVVEDGVNIIR